MMKENIRTKSGKGFAIWIALGITFGAVYGNVGMGIVIGVVVGALSVVVKNKK